MIRSDAGSTTDPLREHLERSLSGSYRLERELGGGGMSRVFLAEESALGRRVVVKVLSTEVSHALSVERFAREVRLSARLQHPNIVPVLTAGVAADVPYYTMPFIEGESLRAHLDRLGPGERLPVDQALDVLRDVARALAYAHEHGVVHRDIKPDNVLLAYDAAVVADFGIAKALAVARTENGSDRATTLTQGGVALGTPAYMSPEQAAGDPAVDHRADLYAWGILAYELLAGAHPFADRRSLQALVTAHLVEQPRPLDEVAPHTAGAVSALVARCLTKDAADRPASAREILDTLPGTLGRSYAAPANDPASATPLTPALSATPPQRRARMAAALALVMVAAGAGIAYAVRSGTTGAVTPATTELSTTRRLQSSPAYDAYLRGKVRVSSENPADIDAAIAALREATTADPDFAPAYAELGRAYTIKGFYFAPDSEKKRLREEAEVAVERALALDPKLAEAHFARGLMLWTPARRFPHEQAVQAYRQALSLDPKLDEAHHQLALVLLHVGLLDEAAAEIDTALAINPANTLARFRAGVIALYRNDFERAYAIFNSTPLDGNPSLWAFQTATALFRLGRIQEAGDLLDRFLRDYPADEGGVGNSVRAMMLAKAGRRREAETAMAKADQLGRNFGHFHHTAYNLASAYAMLGDNSQAIRYLQEAADGGLPCYPLFASDAQLDGLRKDPRFVTLLDRLKRDWEERSHTLRPS